MLYRFRIEDAMAHSMKGCACDLSSARAGGAHPLTNRCTCVAENVLPPAVVNPSPANSSAISRRLRAIPVFGDLRANRFAS
jgi:hypothetical protein